MNPKRILVRGTNWIGDSVMSVATLRELRRLYPESHITLAVRDWVAGLFEGQDLVDQMIALQDARPTLCNVWKLSQRVRGHDTAVLFQNAFSAAVVACVARIPWRFGYATDGRAFLLTRAARPRIQELARHQIFYYLDLLYQTGLSSRDYVHDVNFQPDIRIRPTREGIEQAVFLLERCGVDRSKHLIVLNPGAYFGPAKRWFTDRYATLADLLIRQENSQVVIIGSPAERRIAEEIQSLMKAKPRVLSGQTTLPALIGLLSRAHLLITNDSGPMHLGAALDVPQIALFGSTDERATGPFSPRARIIHKHVECSPCLLRECPIDLRCFRRIEIDEVFHMAREQLNHG